MPGRRMPAHDAGADLEPLLLRRLARAQDAFDAAGVGREGLLHEDVQPLLDGVLDVHAAEGGVRGAQADIAWPQAIHGLLEGVKADETPVRRCVHALAVLLAQALVGATHAIFEQVGHGDELGRPSGGLEGVRHGAGAASAAAHDGEADGVVLRGMDVRQGHAGEGRCGEGRAAAGKELAAGGVGGLGRGNARRRLRMVCRLHVAGSVTERRAAMASIVLALPLSGASESWRFRLGNGTWKSLFRESVPKPVAQTPGVLCPS